MKRLLLFFVVAIVLHISVFAENAKNNLAQTDSWVLDTVIQNVSFYHQLVNCNGKTAVLLKFENNSGASVKVSWKEGFATLQTTGFIDGFYGMKELVISVGITEPANCTDNDNKKCIISAFDVDPTFIAGITSFKFISPTISIN